MARCGCGGTCNCVIQEGDNTTVVGNGTSGNPYVISTDVKLGVIDTPTVDLTLTGTGTTPDPYEVQADVNISTDSNNCLIAGSDGGLYVACPSGGGGSNVLTGTQVGADVTSITSTTAGAGTSDAEGDNCIAVGPGSFAFSDPTNGAASTVVGSQASADTGGGVAVGDSASSTGMAITDLGGTSVGNNSSSTTEGVAVGPTAYAGGLAGVGVGSRASASQEGDIAIGGGSISNGADGTPPLPGNTTSTVVGYNAQASAQGVAVGSGISADVAGVSVGSQVAWSGSPGQTTVGHDVTTSAPYSTGVGYGVQMGDYGTSSAGAYSTALGASTKARKDGSVALGADHTGAGADSTVQDQIVLGTTLHSTSVPGRFGVATRTPANTADAQGSTGDIAWDASFIYVKTGAGWKRSALSTF